MSRYIPSILIVLLFVGVLYAQVSGTAEIPAQTIPAQRVTVEIPADTTVAKAADLAAANQKISLLEGRVKSLEGKLAAIEAKLVRLGEVEIMPVTSSTVKLKAIMQ